MPAIEMLLTIPETAKLTKLSPRKLWGLIASEQAPPVARIGKSVRLRASDVDLWLKLGCPSRKEFEAARAVRAAR